MNEYGDWTEVANEGVSWKHEKAGDAIEGTLIDRQEDVGEYGSTLYTVKNLDGDSGVWANSVLDDKLRKVPLGAEVRIEFLGLMKNASGSREYKNYKVLYKEAPMQEAE